VSAFIVDKAHIDALLTGGLFHSPAYPGDSHMPVTWTVFEWRDVDAKDSDWYRASRRILTRETADAVGRMLWWENFRSVGYRYPDGELPGPVGLTADDVESYTFRVLPGSPDAVVVLSAIACYEYQTCEHLGWERSEAKRFCDALRLYTIKRLPGYGEAPWEITMPDIFIRYERELAGLEP